MSDISYVKEPEPVELQSQSSVELQSQSSVELQSQSSVEPQTEVKVQIEAAAIEAQTEPQIDVAAVEPETNPAVEVKVETAVEPETKSAVEVKPETNPAVEVKAEDKAETAAEPQTNSVVEVKAEVKAEVNAEVKAEVNAEDKAEVKVEPKAEAEIEPAIDAAGEIEQFMKLNFHTPTDVVKLVASGIRYAARYSHLTGQQKKELVIRSVINIIKSSDLATEDKQNLQALAEIVADPIVDSLVDFGKDTVLFVKSKLSQLWACLCRRLNRSRSSNIEVPTAVVDELTKFIEHQLQPPVTNTKVILLLSQAVKFMADEKLKLNFKLKVAGLSKKTVALTVVRLVIRTTDKINDQERQDILSIVDVVGSEFIDVAVSFGKDTKTFQSSS